jgi:hypothetical protein
VGLTSPALYRRRWRMKKRILVLLSVVALMVVMLATSVAPAFAAWDPVTGCRGVDPLVSAENAPGVDGKRTADGMVCSNRIGSGFKFYDNREPVIIIP